MRLYLFLWAIKQVARTQKRVNLQQLPIPYRITFKSKFKFFSASASLFICRIQSRYRASSHWFCNLSQSPWGVWHTCSSEPHACLLPGKLLQSAKCHAIRIFILVISNVGSNHTLFISLTSSLTFEKFLGHEQPKPVCKWPK